MGVYDGWIIVHTTRCGEKIPDSQCRWACRTFLEETRACNRLLTNKTSGTPLESDWFAYFLSALSHLSTVAAWDSKLRRWWIGLSNGTAHTRVGIEMPDGRILVEKAAVDAWFKHAETFIYNLLLISCFRFFHTQQNPEYSRWCFVFLIFPLQQ